jgi:aminopeptidase N
LDIIPKAYSYFENFFGIKEVVRKSDHIAAPDFNGVAMENWGAIVYRESSLLFDPEKSLLEDEYFVLLVICHEVSHSWFGKYFNRITQNF